MLLNRWDRCAGSRRGGCTRERRRQPHALLAAPALALGLSLAPSSARADSYTLERPGAHPRYFIDGELHGLAAVLESPNPESDSGFGLGLRATWKILDDGFLPTVNDTFGVGVGLDWLTWGSGRVEVEGSCVLMAGGVRTCQTERRKFNELMVPVVAQWSFWFTRLWSAFAEPGFAMRFRSGTDNRFEPFVFFVGGRYMLYKQSFVVVRVGYPYVSLGANWVY